MFEPDATGPNAGRFCELCGNTRAGDTEGSWARYAAREPGQDDSVQAIMRCKDRAACRRRVESTGATWPVRDPGDGKTPPAGTDGVHLY